MPNFHFFSCYGKDGGRVILVSSFGKKGDNVEEIWWLVGA